MQDTPHRTALRLATAVVVATLLAACGGGGGSSGSPQAPPPDALGLTVGVNGAGRVTSLPGGVDCGSDCSESFPRGAVVTLTATPDARQQLAGWSGACTGTALTCTVSMTVAQRVEARFTPSPSTRYSLGVTTTGDGRVTSAPAGIDCGATCTAVFDADTAVTLTAAAGPGHTFEGWGGACSGTAATCRVTLAAARTASAAFRATAPLAGWGDLVRLAGGGATAPVVAIDDADRATAVWLRPEPGTGENHVWASRSSGGTAWGTPVRLEANVGNVTQLRLAIDRRSGFGMLLWTQTGATQDLHARALDPVNGWGPEARVENSAGVVGGSAVGVDAAGNAIAVWAQIGPTTRFSVYASRYTAAGGWSTPVLLEDNEAIGSQDGEPRIGVTPGGDAWVVWRRSGAGAEDGFWGVRQSGGASWSRPAQLVADAGPLQSFGGHALTVADDGQALLVWGQLDIVGGVGNHAMWFKRGASGAWSSASARVAPATTNSQGFISQPVLQANAAGDAVVGWVERDNALRVAMALAGADFGVATTVRAANPGTWVGLPALAIDDARAAMAVWADPVGRDAMFSRTTDANAWSAPTANEVFPDPSFPPALAMNGRGAAVKAWPQAFSGSADELILRRFSAGR